MRRTKKRARNITSIKELYQYVTLLSQPVLRRAGARSHDFVVAIAFVYPPCTSPGDPQSIPRPRNAELSPFWQIGQLPSCTCKSMFVDPERRTLAVAWSFKYQSPPGGGANPELQDEIALRKPGPHHAALVLAYRPRL